MNTHRAAAFGGCLLVAAISASAADASKPEDVTTADYRREVVVTATRDARGAFADTLGSSFTILSQEDLEKRQTRYVSDILRDVPGVAVSRLGFGGQTQVRMRGAEGNHTLVMIDGIEASDPFFGEFDFATLIADDVARVEVLRGQQSALYGSDAIGGVINYITLDGREAPGLRTRLEGGSFGTKEVSARFAGATETVDYALSGGYRYGRRSDFPVRLARYRHGERRRIGSRRLQHRQPAPEGDRALQPHRSGLEPSGLRLPAHPDLRLHRRQRRLLRHPLVPRPAARGVREPGGSLDERAFRPDASMRRATLSRTAASTAATKAIACGSPTSRRCASRLATRSTRLYGRLRPRA